MRRDNPWTWFRTLVLPAMLVWTPAEAATLLVTRGDDPAPNGCRPNDCSLREALADALIDAVADEVVLGDGFHVVTRGTLDVRGEVVLSGTGMSRTSIAGVGAFDVLKAHPLSRLTVRDVSISAESNLRAVDADQAALRLQRIGIAPGAGTIRVEGFGAQTALLADAVDIGGTLVCSGDVARCEVLDSTIGSITVSGEQSTLTLRGSVVQNSVFGVGIATRGAVEIRDSVIRNQVAPLYLVDIDPPGDVAPVTVVRTRFLANRGPLRGARPGLVLMQDVEFRSHRVDDTQTVELPSVLLVERGPQWRIDRASFVDNRGGIAEFGATIRVLGGAEVIVSNATFHDNRAREELGQAFADTIGVNANSSASTVLWLIHSTLVQPETISQPWPAGTLLAVRGTNADVRVINSVMSARNACRYSNGGALLQALGNVDIDDSCGFDAAQNFSNVSFTFLRLGDLGDHGGFTATFLPQDSSFLSGRAVPGVCSDLPLDQRAYPRSSPGEDCDVGAVEIDAAPELVHSDGFE